MKTALVILLLFFSSTMASFGAEGPLDSVDVDVFNSQSVRRGAALFANYCLGCHSLRQTRYSRIGKDLDLDEAVMRDEFMFGDNKIHENVLTAFPDKQAEAAFGIVPPDLSLVIRAKGANWVYTYLKSFYTDPKTPWGVNNLILQNAAMPNVLWQLQGIQDPVLKAVEGAETVVGVKQVEPGTLSKTEFEGALTDLVNFLAYVAEPSQLQRLPLGKYVIVFLIGLTLVLYQLKKAYWKNLH